jgi:dTDP-4-dehydrorhamnose reductase
MKILVAGGHGQLGRAVARRGAKQGHTVSSPDIDELDITDAASVERALVAAKPDLVINAAAYTAVDKAESERELAFKINRDGPGVLAEACRAARVQLLGLSTDYVFDGTATAPIRESHPMGPLGVYGASKAEGEAEIRNRGGAIVRTSWLFEEKGPSFVHTMLKLAKDRPVLRVVADQLGSPTWADDLADALIVLAPKAAAGGVYHFVNDGVTSWHAFATEIIEEGRRHRPLACERIDAITTAEYPTPAKRPRYSVLDTSKIRALGIVPPPWRAGLVEVVSQIFAQEQA